VIRPPGRRSIQAIRKGVEERELNDPEANQSRTWDIAMEITGAIGYRTKTFMKAAGTRWQEPDACRRPCLAR